MLKQQFYLKTFTTILVFSFVISYFIYVSKTYLQENVDDSSSKGSYHSYQLRRNAADTAYDGGSIGTNKNPEKYIKKNQKTVNIRKIRRKRFSAKRTKKSKSKYIGPDENYWHDLKSNLSNLTEEDILKNDYVKALQHTKKELRALEKRTKKQYKCEEWHRERKKRLTASTFGRICKMSHNTEVRQRYVDYLLYGTFIGNDATRHGLKFENTAKKTLEKALGKRIRNSGLIVDYSSPFLAATPDGLVARNAIVEIKCPHVAKNMTPEEGITANVIKYCDLKDGHLHLKVNSFYYYQVQGQLHITSKLICYFCVWTPKGMLFEIIKRDDNFWEKNMESQLRSFYFDNMLPELILHGNDTFYD